MTSRTRTAIIIVSIIALALAGLIFIRNLIDFPVYYSAGQSLIAGRTDLYAPDFARGLLMDYRYPPFFLIAFYPLWLLPYSAAAYVWYVFSILETAASAVFLRRLLNPPRSAWLIALLAAGQHFVMELHYGNAHLMAIFLLFASLYFFAQKKDALAALMMALSITIKLTPVLLLPYFAIKRRWKFLAITFALLVGLNIAPAAYLGFQENSRLLGAWYDHVLVDQEFHEVNGPINLSLKGELRRLLTEVDYSQRIDGDTRYRAVNLFSLSTAQSDRAWMILASAVYLLALGLIFVRSKKEEDHSTLALELGLMISVMLFVGPLTSKIYFIALLWPVVSLADYSLGCQKRAERLGKRALIVISAANLILPLLPGRYVQRLLLVAGADFLVNLLLMGALFLALFDKASAGEPQTQSL